MFTISRSFILLSTVLLMHDCFGLRVNKLRMHPPASKGQSLPPDRWFRQKLDHFDPTNEGVWEQRYQVNASFVSKYGFTPVFLMIGGEGPASAEWMVQGAWIDYAKKYNALCLQLEHRFYGISWPTRDMSTENLKYLSSEQALADLAYFIESMNIRYNFTENNKWIAFGGSYPGSLAAWLRYKYPHLVHAAISTSGPLLAKADFKEYNQVVAKSLATHSDDCVASVRQAAKHFDKLVLHPLGARLLSKKFKLCSDLNVQNAKDISTLAEALSDNFAGVVQYNKDNRFSKNPLGKVTIDDLCNIMINRSIGEPLDRYAAVNEMVMKISNSTCVDNAYKKQIKALQNITWSRDRDDEAAGRTWLYQTCTEFGFYQTSSSDSELFGSNIPLDYFVDQCKDIYGPGFTPTVLNEGIVRTNMIYGDLHIVANRVLYVHGSIDPWHALGIISTIHQSSPAIYINGTAHCANMYPPSENDPEDLKEARIKISEHIGSWLSN